MISLCLLSWRAVKESSKVWVSLNSFWVSAVRESRRVSNPSVLTSKSSVLAVSWCNKVMSWSCLSTWMLVRESSNVWVSLNSFCVSAVRESSSVSIPSVLTSRSSVLAVNWWRSVITWFCLSSWRAVKEFKSVWVSLNSNSVRAVRELRRVSSPSVLTSSSSVLAVNWWRSVITWFCLSTWIFCYWIYYFIFK